MANDTGIFTTTARFLFLVPDAQNFLNFQKLWIVCHPWVAFLFVLSEFIAEDCCVSNLLRTFDFIAAEYKKAIEPGQKMSHYNYDAQWSQWSLQNECTSCAA
jgi:hypothetical protein